MLSVSECADYVGLSSHELLLGPGPSTRHKVMLTGYLSNAWRGETVVREMICADLRAAIDLGARARAADLLLVLRLFLTDHPASTCTELLRVTNLIRTDHRRRPRFKLLSFGPIQSRQDPEKRRRILP